MTESQIKLVCYCGKQPIIETCDHPNSDTYFSCKSGKCPFLLTFKVGFSPLSIPRVNVYKCQIRKPNFEMEEVQVKSFRQQEKAWLEHKKKIPFLSIEEVTKRNEKYMEPFKSSVCRAVVNSIARVNAEIPMIKLLMGIEACHLIKWIRVISQTTSENVPLKHAIEKYFDEADMLIDEEDVESTWFSLMDLMESNPTSINLMNILSDKLRKSQIWYYCIKDIAKANCI